MGKRTLNRTALVGDPFLLPLRGGDNDEDGSDGSESGNQGGSDNPPKPKDRRKDKSKDDDDDEDDPDDLDSIKDPQQRRIAELSREAAQYRRAKNAALREKKALEDRLTALENQGKDETQVKESENQKLKTDLETYKSRLENAILRTAISSGPLKWHDLDDIASKINREDLEIDLDSGHVDGLEAQLKAIAKKKPYLLKESDSAGGGDDQGGDTSGSSGHNPRGNGARSRNRQESAEAQRAKIIKKYPSLREGTFHPM